MSEPVVQSAIKRQTKYTWEAKCAEMSNAALAILWEASWDMQPGSFGPRFNRPDLQRVVGAEMTKRLRAVPVKS